MSTLDTITPSPVTPLRMTEDEYVAWAAEDTNAEWVAGQVVVKMPIDELHDMLQAAIRSSLEALVRQRSLGQVRGDRFAMRLEQLPSRREPDVMFVAAASLPRLERRLLKGPCDIAVEIISPGTASQDYREKFAEYEAGGVREYWIVDPLAKALEAHRLDAAGKYVPIIADDQKRLNSTVVPGWWLRADELFEEPTPTALDLMRSLGVI